MISHIMHLVLVIRMIFTFSFPITCIIYMSVSVLLVLYLINLSFMPIPLEILNTLYLGLPIAGRKRIVYEVAPIAPRKVKFEFSRYLVFFASIFPGVPLPSYSKLCFIVGLWEGTSMMVHTIAGEGEILRNLFPKGVGTIRTYTTAKGMPSSTLEFKSFRDLELLMLLLDTNIVTDTLRSQYLEYRKEILPNYEVVSSPDRLFTPTLGLTNQWLSGYCHNNISTSLSAGKAKSPSITLRMFSSLHMADLVVGTFRASKAFSKLNIEYIGKNRPRVTIYSYTFRGSELNLSTKRVVKMLDYLINPIVGSNTELKLLYTIIKIQQTLPLDEGALVIALAAYTHHVESRV